MSETSQAEPGRTATITSLVGWGGHEHGHHRPDAFRATPPHLPSATLRPLQAVIDTFDCAAFLLTAEGTLVCANSMGLEEIRSARFAVNPSGRLQPNLVHPRLGWQQALREAGICQRSIFMDHAQSGICAVRIRAVGPISATADAPYLLVTTNRDRSRRVEVLHSYARLLGLTKAETALLAELSDGFAISTIAAHRRVKVSTIRSQVKSVLGKSGYSSIRALQATLGRLWSI